MTKIQITMSEEHFHALNHKMQLLEQYIDYNDPGVCDSLVLDYADAAALFKRGAGKCISSGIKIERIEE